VAVELEGEECLQVQVEEGEQVPAGVDWQRRVWLRVWLLSVVVGVVGRGFGWLGRTSGWIVVDWCQVQGELVDW
jgi:hypothetical protein